jgi:Leucine-rich repeat (LRR) protein
VKGKFMDGLDLSDIEELIQRKINSNEIVDLLVSIFEKSESKEIRLELLEFLSGYDLKHTPYFKLFENYLISDVREEIRALAAEIILKNFTENGINALEWTITNDPSPLVLRRIKRLVKELDNSFKLILESKLFEKFKIIAKSYKLAIEEVPFLIDIGIKFMNHNFYIGNQDFHFIYENDLLCIIKKKHIRELGISFISNVPETIGLLTQLEHLDLSYGYVSTLPDSMKKLKHLESINLSWNEFSEFPDLLKSLKNLAFIDIANNNIKYIPEWAFNINKIIV